MYWKIVFNLLIGFKVLLSSQTLFEKPLKHLQSIPYLVPNCVKRLQQFTSNIRGNFDEETIHRVGSTVYGKDIRNSLSSEQMRNRNNYNSRIQPEQLQQPKPADKHKPEKDNKPVQKKRKKQAYWCIWPYQTFPEGKKNLLDVSGHESLDHSFL